MQRNEPSITELARQQTSKQLREVRPVQLDNRIGTSVRYETMTSDALSCHPSQAAEFNSMAQRAGFTGVTFEKNGDCKLPAFGKQRKRYLEFRGVHERNGGY